MILILPFEDMNTQTKSVHQYHKSVWEPSPQEIQVRKYPVKLDGKNLPNSETEDVRGFSLCLNYSGKQMRRIRRLAARRNHRDINRGLNITKGGDRQRADSNYILIKKALAEEGRL